MSSLLCDFAHVIAGAVEMAALVVSGGLGIGSALIDFMLPALIGNVIGGTVLFTLIAYGQIRRELGEQRMTCQFAARSEMAG